MTREELKNMYSMRDILSRFGLAQPNRAGFISCPFHSGDRTASMKIYKDNFHCYGCNANGDIFSFVQMYNDCSFKEAFEFLGGGYEHSVKATLMIAKAKHEHKKRMEAEEKRIQSKREHARLISVYRAMLDLIEPSDELYPEIYNKLQYETYKWEVEQCTA